MEKPKTLTCDTSYDSQLLKIEHFMLHKEYLPFIGSNYELGRILLVGESHYVPNKDYESKDYSREKLKELYLDWYEKPTASIEHAQLYSRWFTTRKVIEDYQYRNIAHIMFSRPGNVIKEVLGEKCPTKAAAFSCVAFCNYFQRPSLNEGKSIILDFPSEGAANVKIFEEIIEAINPNAIIFLSKKAYNSFIFFRSKDYDVYIDRTVHPTSPHWSKHADGREHFERIITSFFSEDTLKEALEDEWPWMVWLRKRLIRQLFSDIKFEALQKGFDVDACDDEVIEKFYTPRKKGRPRIEILKDSAKVAIEIAHNIYMYRKNGEWEYLPHGGQEAKYETPNFKKLNPACRDLSDDEIRTLFVNQIMARVCEDLA